MNLAARAAGPVSPIAQKLLSAPNSKMRSTETPWFSQELRATSSRSISGATVGPGKLPSKDCHVELFPWYGEPFWRRDQFPSILDRFFLKNRRRKNCRALEKRVMTLGEADIFQVIVLGRPRARTLAGRRARVIALFESEKNIP